MTWKARQSGESGNVKSDPTDEVVELEKSNILVMGPTGSGNLLSSLMPNFLHVLRVYHNISDVNYISFSFVVKMEWLVC